MKKLILAGALVGIISAVTSAYAQTQTVGPNEKYCASVQGTIRCEWATLAQCKSAFVGGRSTCMLNPKLKKK